MAVKPYLHGLYMLGIVLDIMIVITLLSIITALLVVTSTSTVYSVLWLVSTFLIISALLGFLNLGFIALLYIIVYVGAIAILFLFVVQLLDLGSNTELPIIDNNNKSLNNINSESISPLVIMISLALLSILVVITYIYNAEFLTVNMDSSLQILFYNTLDLQSNSLLTSNINTINSTFNSTTLADNNQVSSIALWFYGPGLLPLVIISIILLVAMIAPIYLCKDNN